MTTNTRQKIYWDSCCWLSYINAYTDRLPILDALLAEAASDKGNITIYTSVISEVEVAFGITEQLNHALDPSTESKIDAFWADREAVKLLEYHEIIGNEARNLMRLAVTRGWKLKPMDAIHLATAKNLSVNEFHTYDIDKLSRFSDDAGFIICQPHTLAPRLIP